MVSFFFNLKLKRYPKLCLGYWTSASENLLENFKANQFFSKSSEFSSTLTDIGEQVMGRCSLRWRASAGQSLSFLTFLPRQRSQPRSDPIPRLASWLPFSFGGRPADQGAHLSLLERHGGPGPAGAQQRELAGEAKGGQPWRANRGVPRRKPPENTSVLLKHLAVSSDMKESTLGWIWEFSRRDRGFAMRMSGADA